MKDNIKKILRIVIIFLLFLPLLQSCQLKSDFVAINYPNRFYVSKYNTKFGYQFIYNKKINKAEIVSFKTASNRNYSYSFTIETNSKDERLMIDNYYVYGIVFNFEYNDDYFYEFNIKFDDSTCKTIQLNMEIKKIDYSCEKEILPISIPYIGDLVKEVEWVFLTTNDINIKEITIENALGTKYELLINSLEFDSDKVYLENEKIYINANFFYKETDEINYMYLSIRYATLDNEEYIFNTDIAIFGSSIDILRSKIC